MGFNRFAASQVSQVWATASGLPAAPFLLMATIFLSQ